jgi:hypothetical protein
MSECPREKAFFFSPLFDYRRLSRVNMHFYLHWNEWFAAFGA